MINRSFDFSVSQLRTHVTLSSMANTHPAAPVRRFTLSPLSKHLLLLLIATTLTLTGNAAAHASSRYVTLTYGDPQLLREFNNSLYINRKLSRHIRKKNVITLEDEVLAKVDFIVEKVEVVLDMFPSNLHFTLVLLPSSREVSGIYKKFYGKNVNHIAFYSISKKTIYLSVDDTKLQVLAHEIGHMVADHYFTVRPPYTIHELMAQFAEKHVTD